MQEREPLGKRVGRFVALIAIVFALTAAVVVTQRLSEDALAMLIGLSFGALAMVPTLGLGLLIWRREMVRSQMQQHVPSAAAPPVVIVTPQGLPYGNAYGGQQTALGNVQASGWQWAQKPAERRFTVVGGEE